jgi:LuxR family quorum-sensing system transcriptional regulator SolR
MTWQEDDLQAILGCTTPAEVFQILLNETTRLGLQRVSWGIKLPIPKEEDKYLFLSNYSPEWQERYARQGYLAIDPTVKHGFSSILPVLWSDPSMQHDAPEFWEEARSHGLNEGVAQSVWGPQGVFSMLSLSRDSLKFTHAELVAKMPKIIRLTQLVHFGMSRLILPQGVPATAGDLLPHEKEVLKLLAAGMTSQQIADRLNLIKPTVNSRLDNASDKLGASNRMDAVCGAVILGLI